MKKLIYLLLILIGLYIVLGYIFRVVPTYRCPSAMGPDGAVSWCEWSIFEPGLVY